MATRVLEAFDALLVNYPRNPVIWNLYYVCKGLYETRPISVLNASEEYEIKDTPLYVADREVSVLLFEGFFVQGFDVYVHISSCPKSYRFPISWLKRLFARSMDVFLIGSRTCIFDCIHSDRCNCYEAGAVEANELDDLRFYMFNEDFCCRRRQLYYDKNPTEYLRLDVCVLYETKMNSSFFHHGIQACYEKHGDERVVSKSAIKILNPNIWTNCSDEMHKILSRSGLPVKSVLEVLNSDAMFLKCFHHLITCTKCFEYLNSFLALMGEILSEVSDDAIIAFSEVYTKKQNVMVTCYHEQQNRVCCTERDDLIFFDLSAIENENVAMRRFFDSSIHVNEYIKIYERVLQHYYPVERPSYRVDKHYFSS